LAHFKNSIVKSRIFSRELGWSLDIQAPRDTVPKLMQGITVIVYNINTEHYYYTL